MSQNHIKILFGRYMAKTISPAENDELMQLLAGLSNEALEQLLHESYENFEPEKPPFTTSGSTALWQAIRQQTGAETGPVIAMKNRKRLMRWWAAAALLVLSLGAVWLWRNNAKQQPVVTAQQSIVPGGNKAVLTLADGSTIILDSATNGMIAQQGKTKINKREDGQLEYSPQTGGPLTIEHSPLTNLVSTPRGGQYRLLLPDGTEVYLDAASSIRFPVHFTGNKRMVQLTGQAWFHVARNKTMPFHVEVQKGNSTMDVEALGTQFNIMAYEDEEELQTTLLQGSVKVVKSEIGNRQSAMLKPGKQAVLIADSRFTIADADIEKVMAWKNGKFIFNGNDIYTVMRQLSRWYNIEVKYATVLPAQNFEGELPRDVPIEKILKVLAATGAVQFEINNRTIIVLPNPKQQH